jgi:hypothetical protein
MALQDAEQALIDAIKAQLVAQFEQKAPPQSPDEGLQRIATAVGHAVINILNDKLEIDIPTINSLPFNGTAATIAWKK